MYAPITTYRRRDLVIEVLPGTSHSDAWAAVTRAGGDQHPLVGARARRARRAECRLNRRGRSWTSAA
jgi:hypothetical protein